MDVHSWGRLNAFVHTSWSSFDARCNVTKTILMFHTMAIEDSKPTLTVNLTIEPAISTAESRKDDLYDGDDGRYSPSHHFHVAYGVQSTAGAVPGELHVCQSRHRQD